MSELNDPAVRLDSGHGSKVHSATPFVENGYRRGNKRNFSPISVAICTFTSAVAINR
jgi:hypothetical protein